jgi:outer membrane immunogenic protein
MVFYRGIAVKNSKLISAVVAVSAMLGVGAAQAADLPMKAMPYAAPAPVFSWTGCYIGVHGGAGVLLDQGFQDDNRNTFDRHGVGGLAGGQAGCNYQTGMLVLGIEGEGFWSGMKIKRDVFSGNELDSTATIKNKSDFDIAARFGVAFDHALVYGKAGWVSARFAWNSSFADCSSCTTFQANHNLDGLLIGLGLEYAFLNNWTVKFEYDYLGFGAKNVSFTSTCGGCSFETFTQNVSADKHIFKVGLNYLFNMAGPVVAKY